MRVLENRDKPDSRTIRFPVVTLHAATQPAKPDPVIVLGGGGPGGSLYLYPESIGYFWEEWEQFVFESGRDLILMDQRGAGLSQPSLVCPELLRTQVVAATNVTSAAEDARVTAAAAQTCRDRLAGEGVDLTAYNSATSAADVEELRQALGYKQWNIYGVSYAGRLGLSVVRDHPAGVRSVIIDSGEAPSALFYEEAPYSVNRALNLLAQSCEAQASCRQANGSVVQHLTLLESYYLENPTAVPVVHPYTQEEFTFVVTDWRFTALLFDALYSREGIQHLPWRLAKLAADPDNTTLLAYLIEEALWSRLDPTWSDGLYYSVGCREEFPFNDLPGSLLISQRYPLGNAFHRAWIDYEARICKLWGAGQADPIEQQPVRSEIPAAIFYGAFDPVTPPRWGYTIHANFPNSVFYEFPHETHGVLNQDNTCAQNLAVAFLHDPNQAPRSAKCVAEGSLEFQ